MRNRLVLLALVAAPLCIPGTVTGQIGGSATFSTGDRISDLTNYELVGGRVYAPNGQPITRARVIISNNVGSPLQYLQTDDRGEFRAQYSVVRENSDMRHFTVMLKISKKGFEVEHRVGVMGESVHTLGMSITLRPLQPEDPELLSQEDLFKSVAPRLRQLGPADGLSPKSAKNYARSVQAFDRHQLDEAILTLVTVSNSNPSCLRCRTMLGLAELRWGDWEDARNDLGKSVNALIADSKIGSAEPLLAYGVLLTWQHDLEKAGAYFNGALKYNPQDPLALQELGRVQCLEMDWYAGSESLNRALAAGAGPEARLMRAKALLYAGSPRDAEAELDRYLNGGSIKSAPAPARAVWANIQARKKDQVAVAAEKAKSVAKGQVPLDYLRYPPRNLPDFEPAADQSQLRAILAAAGKNVSDLFANLPNICSIETIHQEKLSPKGKPAWAQEYKYRYLLLVPGGPSGLSIDEYRADSHGEKTYQAGPSDNAMLTAGFVSAPLVFHPAYQNGSNFRLLGRQISNSRSTFVVAYAQDPGKSRLMGSFQQGAKTRLTYYQGIAWIDTESYQIIRLTTDLLNPIPRLRLERETTEIEFNEVKFRRPEQKFWLPRAVTVTLDWNGKLLRNQHAYSDFLLSNVESSQKLGKPKGAEKIAEDAAETLRDVQQPSAAQSMSFDSADRPVASGATPP